MKIFSYNEYIKCIHTLRLNAVLQLAEENSSYNIKKKTTHNKHDKLMKSILRNKKEISNLINQFLEPKELIKEENLIRYTNSYISKKYKSKEADIVYKLKNKEIYFLIEHQSSIDSSMPYRILNYCIDIIQEWCKSNRNKKMIKYPIVVPIVIYTGDTKWRVQTNFKDRQISTRVFERYKINLEYNLIDVNKLSTNMLLKSKSMFGYGMLIEKSKNKEDLRNNINLIIRQTENKYELEELSDIINYILNDILEETEQEDLLNKIYRKVGENSMSTLYDRLLAETKNTLKQGRMEGIMSIIKNMLSMNFDDQTILKATNVKKEELEKIKSEMKVG